MPRRAAASFACTMCHAGEVAAPDVEHLALLHEHVHRLPDLVPRRVAVDVVHLVEVDVVGLQPAQAVVARLADVRAPRAGPSFGQSLARVVDLGREHRPLAPTVALREPAADDRLGEPAPVAVDVGGVEEVDAELEARGP